MKKVLFSLLAVVLLVGCTVEQPSKSNKSYRRYLDTIQVTDSVWVVNAVYKGYSSGSISVTKILTISKKDGK